MFIPGQILSRREDHLRGKQRKENTELVLYKTKVSHSPPSFCDDHLGATRVELVPELLGLEIHFRIVLDIVILRGRGPGREGSEGEAGEQARITIGGVKTVSGPET